MDLDILFDRYIPSKTSEEALDARIIKWTTSSTHTLNHSVVIQDILESSTNVLAPEILLH